MTGITILHDGLVFPEYPRWHDDSLWFSDCHDSKVINMAPDGRVLGAFDVPGGPSGIGWLPDGTMLIVSIDGLCIYRRGHDGMLTRYADLSAHHRFHTNDMVVDRAGNAYVGEIGFRWQTEEARSTSVLLVRPDGSVQVAATDLTTPNGTVITADHRTLIVAESREKRLTAFTIAEDGLLVDRRMFAQLGPEQVPDGICLDAEGSVWVATPRERAVLRVGAGGEVVERLHTEAGRPYACMLGGPERLDLFVCLAGSHDPEVTRRDRHGAIAVARVVTPGSGYP